MVRTPVQWSEDLRYVRGLLSTSQCWALQKNSLYQRGFIIPDSHSGEHGAKILALMQASVGQDLQDCEMQYVNSLESKDECGAR